PINTAPALSNGARATGSSAGVAPPPPAPEPSPQRGKLPPTELERRYAQILAAFGEFNVKVERPRGEVPYQEGPAFVEYAVFPSYGVSVNKIESKLDDLKLRL